MAKIFKRITTAVILCTFLASLIMPMSFAATITGWTVVNNGDQNLTSELDMQEKHGGNAALRLSYETEGGDNVYAMLRQYIDVKKNTTYRYSMWVKADKIKSVQTCISWGTRYAIDSLGKSFDWRKFEFSWYSGDKDRAEFQFLISGSSKNLWVDDFTFTEEGSDLNLLQNPDFETGVTATAPVIKTDEVVEEVEEIVITNDDVIAGFSQMGNDFLDRRYLPVIRAKDITFDADFSDWEDTYFINGSGSGIKAEFATKYDDEYLYIAAKTPDDVHVESPEGSAAWKNDSLQIAIGSDDEMYGREVNIYFYADGTMNAYSSGWTDEQRTTIKGMGKNADGASVYELAIPWGMLGYSPEADNLRFNLLVNDNDGEVRTFFEFTDGIGIGTKSNTDFTLMDFIADGETASAICAPLMIYTNAEFPSTLYVINTSDSEKEVFVNTAKGEMTVSIPSGGVYKNVSMMTITEGGETSLKASVNVDGASADLEKSVIIRRTEEKIYEDAEIVKTQYLPEIKALLDECAEKNIATGYELAYYKNVEFFVDRVIYDMENDFDVRAEYILDSVIDTYEKAKESLEGYLSGEKEPKTVYKYVTSEVTHENQTLWGNAVNTKTGDIEHRPVYLMGHNIFPTHAELRGVHPVEYFADMGFNSIAFEIGYFSYIYDAKHPVYWNVRSSKESTVEEVVYDAESQSRVLKITSDSASAANKYMQLTQNYTLKPNTTYEYGCRIKGENVDGIALLIGGWKATRKALPTGTYGWQNCDFEYTTTEDQTALEFMLLIGGGKVTNAYIDDVYVREKGTKTNLLANGNFETGADWEEYNGMIVDQSALDNVAATLDRAAEKNISVTFQIATHYWPASTTFYYPEATHKGHFTGNVNYHHDRVREVSEFAIKKVIETIKDKPAVNSVIVANEPQYTAMESPETYEPMFREYLKHIYDNDINNLNAKYKKEYTSFEQIDFEDVKQGHDGYWIETKIDMPEVEKSAIYYDFINFNSYVYTDWIGFLYNSVHKYAPDLDVHIKQLASTWASDDLGRRHYLRNGVNVEQIAEVTDYNGCDAQGILGQGNNISTKMRWYDYMTSIDNVLVFNSEDHSIPDGDDDISPEVALWAGATMWLGAIHGCTGNNTWVWSLSYDPSSAVAWSVMARPDAALAQQMSSLDLNRLAYEVKAITDAKAKVAVMDSIPSQCLDPVFDNVSYSAWQASTYCGQQTDFITEKQCAEGKLNEYKLVIIPKCDRVAPATVEALREYINNGGRVIMLGENCLEADEYGNEYDESFYQDIKAASRIIPIAYQETKMSSPTGSELREVLWQEYDALGISKVRLVDVKTGETVYDVEWECAEYDGGIVISANNYNWSSKPEIAIEVNGQRTESFTELRSEETISGSFVLNPYQPVLIKIENATLE